MDRASISMLLAKSKSRKDDVAEFFLTKLLKSFDADKSFYFSPDAKVTKHIDLLLEEIKKEGDLALTNQCKSVVMPLYTYPLDTSVIEHIIEHTEMTKDELVYLIRNDEKLRKGIFIEDVERIYKEREETSIH